MAEKIFFTTVDYPVIVCNTFNNFYKTDMDSAEKSSSINDHFQLEVDYAYIDINKKHRNEYFLINVLDFQNMDKFLESLQEDVDAISVMLED